MFLKVNLSLQKQLITARLMEISLKVDDHIYRQKLISDLDAELYLKEVGSYKPQCSGDERSLQVIEKLIRCMKAIIIDHQEQRGDSHEEPNMREGSSSPVYSMPDEDRTYLTQPVEGGINVTEPNNDVEIIDLVDSDDEGNHEADNATAESSRLNVEVDLHRGMSSLSLKDTEQLDTTVDINCSQSILNNFEGVVNEIHLEKTTVPSDVMVNINAKAKAVDFIRTDKEVFLHNYKTPIVEQRHTDNLKIMDHLTKTSNATKTHYTPESTLTVITNQPKIIKTTTNVLTMNPIEKYNNNTSATDISDTQRQTWYDSNKTCSINNFGQASETQLTHAFERVGQKIISTAQNVLDLNTGVPINTYRGIDNTRQSNTPETLINKENSENVKKKRCPRKKVTNEVEVKPKNRRGPKPKEHSKIGSKKNKSVPIYNKNVENDLSWVENIRYVREIKEDENETQLNIEESFWCNYYLPNNWNDNDFLY
ncbi:uncharacterized protein LOC124630936 [Helicoverpa zea]|uniref:uncharacterized protein LOC124630936 n=1 Tax=Helicoverpa zea TaxID=7113 RepID=UPI001F5AFFC3|nr:uncharacterized protein LOC124630936 [Helicoverpa zea]